MTAIRSISSAAAALALACASAQAQTVSFDIEALTVAPGETFSLNLKATDFAGPVLGGGFGLTFDPSVLRLDSVAIPANWEFAKSGGLIDNASGTLSDAYFATNAPVPGDVKLATLTFTALNVGQSLVTPLTNTLQPFVEDGALEATFPTYRFATVTVAVPEPSSLALFLAGGLALTRLRSRRS
jgi:hypothetical protein